MRRLIGIVAIAWVLSLSSVGGAEARVFEPQANWQLSGQLCAATRPPPGRRWRALPPRSCGRQGPVEARAAFAARAFGHPLEHKPKWAALGQA